jgi:hypothetical protein
MRSLESLRDPENDPFVDRPGGNNKGVTALFDDGQCWRAESVSYRWLDRGAAGWVLVIELSEPRDLVPARAAGREKLPPRRDPFVAES